MSLSLTNFKARIISNWKNSHFFGLTIKTKTPKIILYRSSQSYNTGFVVAARRSSAFSTELTFAHEVSYSMATKDWLHT